jgi:hypothetical protein
MKSYTKIVPIVIALAVIGGGVCYFTKAENKSLEGSTLYSNANYSLRLLPDYQSFPTPLAGDLEVSIKKSEAGNYPRIQITVTNSQGSSLELTKKEISDWSYVAKEERQIFIDGIPASQIKGILGTKTVNGEIVEGQVMVTNIIFERNQQIFTISLQSEAEADHKDLEKMLKTLELN